MIKGFYGWPYFFTASVLLQALLLSSVSLSKTGIPPFLSALCSALSFGSLLHRRANYSPNRLTAGTKKGRGCCEHRGVAAPLFSHTPGWGVLLLVAPQVAALVAGLGWFVLVKR